MSVSINNIPTWKSGGLLRAISMFNQAQPKRITAPKIVATFTDGASTEGNLPQALVSLNNSGLTSIAVGIGSNIRHAQLVDIALDNLNGDCVYGRANYAEFPDFANAIYQRSCQVPQQPQFGEVLNGTLIYKEDRYFYFPPVMN